MSADRITRGGIRIVPVDKTFEVLCTIGGCPHRSHRQVEFEGKNYRNVIGLCTGHLRELRDVVEEKLW